MKPSIMALYYSEERCLLASLMAEYNSKVYILPDKVDLPTPMKLFRNGVTTK